MRYGRVRSGKEKRRKGSRDEWDGGEVKSREKKEYKKK